MKRSVLSLALAFAAAAGPIMAVAADSPAPAASAAASAPVNAWGHEGSDLKPDPAARFGVLPNGMRYMIYRNATPPGEVSIRLRFAVGKLYGPDERHGLAHFIEHMAFNGSTHVPEGEIVKRLERIGLRFGADSNAVTAPTETVYQLDIPGSTDEKLDVGFLYMRELASELNFGVEALERERGVIQSEERSQYTPIRLASIARVQFLLKGQHAANRQTIGDAKAIASGQRDTFVDIYHRYYRPERATLVVVGDLDPDKIEAEIVRRFSDWKAVGPAGEEPDLGRLAPREVEAASFVAPGVNNSLNLNWLRPYEARVHTRAENGRQIREALVLSILNRRLSRLIEAGGAPFTTAGAGSGEFIRSAETTAVTVSPIAGREAEAVRVVEQEVRRLVQHGVLPQELERAVTNSRAALQTAVAGAGTRRTAALAGAFAASVDDREVILSPAQNLELFEEAVRGFGPEAAGAVARDAFKGYGPLIFTTSATPIPGGDAALVAALQESRKLAVAPPVATVVKPWTYAAFGPAGKVVERTENRDLGFTRVRFANGVVLNVKPTAFRKDQILVSVRFAGGRRALPRDLVTWPVTQGALISGGLKTMTDEERKEALAGKVYSVAFGVGDDAFVLTGGTRPTDLATQMQVLAAYATDAGWREDAYLRTRTDLANALNQVETRPFNVAFGHFPQMIRSGDQRWGLPERGALAAAGLAPVRKAMEPVFARAPLEVTMVGDVTVERAIAETAATFAALPRRDAKPVVFKGSEAVSLAATGGDPLRLSHAGRPDVGLGLIGWRTDDVFDDMRETRVIQVLRSVIELRALAKLREELGSTYSPVVQNESSEVFDEVGLLTVAAEVKPDQIDVLMGGIEAVAQELVAAEVTADELARAKTPILAQLAKDKAGNEYWLGRLSGSSWEPRRLAMVADQEAVIGSVTAADIQRAARTYLTPDRAWRLLVTKGQ
jgi:zinc protease